MKYLFTCIVTISIVFAFSANTSFADEVRICVLDKYAATEARLSLLDRQGNPTGPTVRLELDEQTNKLLLTSGLRRPSLIARTVFKGEGGIRISIGDKGEPGFVRTFPGKIAVASSNNSIEFINIVHRDEYLAGVIAAEMAEAPVQAQIALAVAARSVLAYRLNHPTHPDRTCDVCDLTHCQAYSGSAGVTPAIRQAITDSTGYILTYDDQPLEALYHSTCGGHTASVQGLWNESAASSPLVAVNDIDPLTGDPFCAASPHSDWEWKIAKTILLDFIERAYHNRVLPKIIPGDHERVIAVAIGPARIPVELFRSALGGKFGWNKLKSNRFSFEISGAFVIFSGHGLGHGVGLCQYGAIGLARQGKSWREILTHYYPHAELQPWK
jgi:stage II sporulation protein D (peptidoglycan lytic transglycosylase)